VIQRQDYQAWLAHLTPEYVAYYSDPVLLAQYSEYPILKRQGVNLRTLKDYFVYLVYPSRQNDRVDDIDFVSENLVKAITVSPKGNRDILYILEKHGDTWKIGIGR
jgi:S-adenosylmethionine:diacylglycerol 3-amino-3-carboxypropyl transferase